MNILKLIKKEKKSIIIGNRYSKEPIKIIHSNILTSSLKYKLMKNILLNI